VPGIHATLHITPNRIGTYPVICTELCGLGHALMRSRVVVMDPTSFEKWAETKGQ
jgi:cytochrome c oxidase subunit 2